MSEQNSELGAFLAGFVIGGLVGAATALILAPQSGEQTRAQLVSKSEELRRAGEEQVQHVRELADTYTHEYLEKAEAILHDTRDRVEEQARIVLDSGKEQAAKVREQVIAYVQPDDGDQEDSTESAGS